MTRPTGSLSTPAFAQPAGGGGLAPTIDPSPTSSALIFFGWDHRPKNYPIATVASQMARQTTLQRGVLDAKQPNTHQVEFFRKLQDSIFTVARFVQN